MRSRIATRRRASRRCVSAAATPWRLPWSDDVAETMSMAVIGAGTMGHGIAQVLAQNAIGVALIDIDEKLLARAVDSMKQSLGRLVKKGALAESDLPAVLGRVKPATRLEAAAGCDVVVEAVSENTELKRKIFAELDRLCPPSTILASNTSSISITLLAAATRRAPRVIG